MKTILMATIAAAGFLLAAGQIPASAAPASSAAIAGENAMVSEAQMRRRSYRRRMSRARRPAMRAPTDGNTRMPSRMENLNVPASQRGSGAETGGPARELIPRR